MRPNIFIENFYQFENNRLNYFQYDAGFSISEYHRNSFGNDLVAQKIEIDFDEKSVKIETEFNRKITLFQTVYVSLDSYFQNNFIALFKEKFAEQIGTIFKEEERTDGQGILGKMELDFSQIGVTLPKSVRRIMGNKVGSLNLDGSQKLTIEGSNTTRDNATMGEGDDKNDFNMRFKQDLDLRLHGTIGEKIHVKVNHRSTSDDNVMPTPSEININYEGIDDEVIKRIDAGNISLSLSGSQFISYSASSEGLFGIKSELKAGNLELTTIFGKDEAKKDTKKYNGNSQADSTEIESRNFVNRTHYFITQPTALFELYDENDTEIYPESWKGNAIKLNEFGDWMVKSPELLPNPDENFTLYLDDHNTNNNTNTIAGREIAQDDYIYNFEVLLEGTDYFVNYNAGLITLNRTINKLYTIGVRYFKSDSPSTEIGSSDTTGVTVQLLRKSNQDDDDTDYWDLQVRNIYNLGMTNIKNDGFSLNVFTKNEDGTPNYYVPTDVADGDYSLLNDYLRLDGNRDGLINGEDATVNLESGFIIFPFLKPFFALNDSIIYQEDFVNYNEFENYIAVKGNIGRDKISLGQMNILPKSVVIYIGSAKDKLSENVDYVVDYDFGIITMLTSRAKDPDVEIEIDYQFRPLFSVDSRTIIGMRADLRFNENAKIGGIFVYQSEKVKEDRPKIGNENRSIILADIDGTLEYELPFVTKFIDWLPLIKTDTDSKINISGEVAMSIPQIFGSDKQHDKKEAYVDDMESIMDSYPLGVSRVTWSPASKPAGDYFIGYGASDINYFMPKNIYKRDVYDNATLTENEEREKVSVLVCKMTPQDSLDASDYWSGLMKYIGNQVDLSEKKYLEFLIKVDTIDSQLPNSVKMHINLGTINENFYTFTDTITDGEIKVKLDKEDGIISADGILDFGEDVGLDGIINGEDGDDPNDDWSNVEEPSNSEIYPYINGTEGNGKLDSEDLDDNGILNEEDVYFDYSLDLLEDSEYLQNDYNGWRLFRIPLLDETVAEFSSVEGKSPDLEKISYARIWFELDGLTQVKLVSLDLVGNKWRELGICDENGVPADTTETMQVGLIDNQKNAHYTPAPYTVIEKNGVATLEQSLIIDFENVAAGHYGMVTQEFRESFNLLSYNKIRFWAYCESEIETDSEHSVIFRLGADTLDFYEIQYDIEVHNSTGEMDEGNWEKIEIDFSEITALKNITAEGDTVTNGHFRMVGNPTLTNIEEMSLGLKVSENFSGRIYFDDIRVAEPYEDVGFAARTSINTSFADFSTLNITFNWKTQNFQSSARRTTSPTYNEDLSLNVVSKYNLHKFFPTEWGFSIPLTLTRNQSLGIPRFKANSDILREDLPAGEEKERQKNESLIYRASISLNQNKTPKNKILEILFKNSSLAANVEQKEILAPTSTDTTFSFDVKHEYDFDIQKDDIDLKLFGDYKFYFLPKEFTNKLHYKEKDPHKWRWNSQIDSVNWEPVTTSYRTRTFETVTSIKYDIFSDFISTYKLTTERDLMLQNILKNKWKDFNVGQEKERKQDFSFDFTPHYFDGVFVFDADATVNYDEGHVKASATNDTLFYEGSVTRKINGKITLKNRDMLSDFATWIDEKFPVKNRENKEDVIDKKEEKAEQKGENEKEPEKDKIQEKDENKDKNDDKDNESENQSKPRKNFISSIVNYIARLDNISLNYDNYYKTSYENRRDRPEFLYQFGAPHILIEEGDEKEIESKQLNDKYSTSFGFAILDNLNTSLSYSLDIKRTYSDHSNMDISTIFPNISVTLSEFEKLIHFEEILTSSRITSSFSQTITESGELDFETPETRNTTINLSPLFSWRGNWAHDFASNISLNYRAGKNIRYYDSYEVVTKTNTQSISGNVSWSFKNPKGVKILFFKRTNMKNEFSTDINFSMENIHNTNENTGNDESPSDEVSKFSYSVTPGASYKFNKSIAAGLSSKYEWNDDKKRNKKTKIINLGIWVEIKF
ncbi:MAG: cell surface protein SprA [Candidatus Cloacimonetes bacterium]|nr:cell surface protein SprA [Candidatus Cloacimonadota bacterium]